MKQFKIDKVEVLENGDIQVRQKELLELKDGSFALGSQNSRFVIKADDKELFDEYKEELKSFGIIRG